MIIEYWHRNSENAGGPTIEAYAKAFNESQDKYEVKPVFMTDAYKGIMQKLMAEAAAGKSLPRRSTPPVWTTICPTSWTFAPPSTARWRVFPIPLAVPLCTTTTTC